VKLEKFSLARAVRQATLDVANIAFHEVASAAKLQLTARIFAAEIMAFSGPLELHFSSRSEGKALCSSLFCLHFHELNPKLLKSILVFSYRPTALAKDFKNDQVGQSPTAIVSKDRNVLYP